MPSTLSSCASPGTSEDLLERFLRDMDALEHQNTKPSSIGPETAAKKRKLDVSVGPQPAKKKLPSWLKRKQELEALRQQTQAMETRVAYLEMKRSSSTGGLNAFERYKAQSFALEKKQKCIAAQNENEKLKAKLLVYAKQYEAFQKVIFHPDFQYKELLRMVSGALQVEMGAAAQLQNCSVHVFDMLERRMDARSYELDHAYTAMKQPMISMDTDLIQTRDDNRGAVEFTRLELLPFEEKTITSTLWSFVLSGKFPAGEHSIVNRRTDDSMAISTRVTVQIDGGGTVTIDTFGVMKRFVTAEGYAVMTESYSEWNVDSPTSGTWKHTTREGGCFVVREYSTDGGASPGICQARSMLCLYPHGNEEKARYYSQAPKSIHNVVVPSFRQLTLSRHQFMQNCLYDTVRISL